MPSNFPNPSTWCLKFKLHTTTILLHVDPLTKLSVLRTQLHSAIQQTHPTGTLHTYKIPSSASDIVLARPVDINDLSLGWEALDIDSNGSSSKGKAKSTAKGKGSDVTNSPKGAGLRDGGIVAFRFRTEAEKEKALKADNVKIDEDGFEDIGDVDVDEIAAKGVGAEEAEQVVWDVQVAVYDEEPSVLEEDPEAVDLGPDGDVGR